MDARREAEQEAAEDRMSFTELADRDAADAVGEAVDVPNASAIAHLRRALGLDREARAPIDDPLLHGAAHAGARSAAYTATQDRIERAEARHERIMHMSRTELINAALGAISSGRVDDDTLRDFCDDWT